VHDVKFSSFGEDSIILINNFGLEEQLLLSCFSNDFFAACSRLYHAADHFLIAIPRGFGSQFVSLALCVAFDPFFPFLVCSRLCQNQGVRVYTWTWTKNATHSLLNDHIYVCVKEITQKYTATNSYLNSNGITCHTCTHSATTTLRRC
jgi:hypothetical protein